MDYIEKKLAPWEIKYGQIRIGGDDYAKAKDLFESYFGVTFKLETFEGSFPNQNFLLYKKKKTIRLSCSQFFSKLKEGNIIYIQPEKPGIIKIYDKEPSQKIEDITKNKNVIKTVQKANKEVTNLLIDLIKENRKLRKTNEYLLIYKDKFEKFQDLKYI